MSIIFPEQPVEIPLAGWASTVRRSALQEMLALAKGEDFISFALGLPAPELFPAPAIREAARQVLDTDPRALQYSPPLLPLKRQIVSLLQERGVSCREEQVFLTCGAQQGLNLLARLLLDASHGKVLVEEMVYTGFQQVLTPLQADMLTVPTSLESGINVSAVEALLASGTRPSFIYVVTDGHNPLGMSMGRSERIRLVELARQYGVPIIEDDAYGFLHYDEDWQPPLRALDERWVFYVGSFSKILAPALRVGWVVVPDELMYSLSIIKEASDIDTATFAQRVISSYLATNHQAAHLESLREAYRLRRNTMLCMMEQHFPVEARWHNPTGGFFIWVELPHVVNTSELLKLAVAEEQIAFIPGQVFSVGLEPRGGNAMRLNFSHSSISEIEDGIARLGRLIKKALASSRLA